MNERIKELVEIVISQNESEWPDFREVMTGAGALYLDVFAETFAELIARECAELSVNSQYANTKNEYYEGFNEALIYVGNKIKTHFGVEE